MRIWCGLCRKWENEHAVIKGAVGFSELYTHLLFAL